VVGRVILLNDITEREQLIAELDAYARTVAHDLKTPINAIMGYAEMLQLQLTDSKVQEEARLAQSVVRTSRKMDSIINSLLLLAELRRLEDIETKAVDMKALVADTLTRLERPIKETGAKITQPDKWPEGVVSFAPWIEEIWANYISNALKYGGTPPHVEIGAALLPDGRARFWVKDNGKGMTPEERERLFTVFSRLAQHKGTEGHGLGLSIVHNIATRLGGEVGVESKPGEGSTFYFVLPVQAAARAEKSAA
jgi:signal transduction histidine kinase